MPNPYHDKRGRFTSKGATGGGVATYTRANVSAAQRGSGSKPPSRTRKAPLTDREWAAHRDHVGDTLTKLREAKVDTESMFRERKADGTLGKWDPQRRLQQDAIIENVYATARDVPRDGQAVMAGGLGGAGKGTALAGPANVPRERYLTINPDDIKEEMASRGMIPHVEGLSPMEASPLVHEEASQMAYRLAERAYADRTNVVWDITMSSPGSVTKRLDRMHEQGYEVDAVFVDVPMETSIARAQKRHRRGEEDYRNGVGNGGRYLPSSASEANAASPGSGYLSHPAEVFAGVRDRFRNTVVLDTNLNVASTTGSRWRARE